MAWQARWHDLPHRLRRTLLVALAILLAIPALTNLALWLRLVPWLLNADSAALSYDFAWSPWPTRLRMHDLHVTGQDQNVQFDVGVDEAWLTLDLWRTFQDRTITITRLRGSGASVRLLQRLQPWAVRPEKVAALPPMPGRSSPPLTEDYVVYPRATSRFYDNISISISDVDATAKELWVDDMHFVGEVHVVGSFLLRPGLELQIGPQARAEIRAGQVSLGKHPLLRAMQGRAACLTPKFNPIRPTGLAILRFFSGQIALKAQLVDMDFLNYVLDSPAVRVSGGAGGLEMHLGLDRGVLKTGSRLAIESHELEASLPHGVTKSSWKIAGAVDEQRRGSLGITATNLSVAATPQSARFEGGQLRGEVTTSEALDLAQPLPTAHYQAELSDLRGDTLAARAYVPADAGLKLDRAQVTASAKASGTTTTQDLLAEARLETEVEAHANLGHFSGKVKLVGRAQQQADGFRLDESTLDISDLMVAHGKKVKYGWWSHVGIDSGTYFTGEAPRLLVKLAGMLRDIEPFYIAAGQDVGVPGWVQGIFTLEDLAFSGQVALESGALLIKPFLAKSGVVTIRAKLTKPKIEEPHGAVKIASGPLSFGIGFSPGETGTELLATDDWFENQP